MNEPFCWPDYEQGWKEVDCLFTLQWKFFNLFVEVLHLPEVWQWVMLNMYGFCLACISVLQYLPLKKKGQAEARAEKQTASPESSQIDAIGMQKKRHRFMNFSLKMQKGFRENLLKLLKSHEDLQGPASKVDRNDLNNFRSDSNSLIGFFKSFKDASEGKIEFKNFNEDFNENQFKTEWIQLKLEEAQQILLQYIIYNYVWKENSYFKLFSFFKSIVHSFQDFDLWIKKMQKETEAEIYLKEYQFNVKSFLQY